MAGYKYLIKALERAGKKKAVEELEKLRRLGLPEGLLEHILRMFASGEDAVAHGAVNLLEDDAIDGYELELTSMLGWCFGELGSLLLSVLWILRQMRPQTVQALKGGLPEPQKRLLDRLHELSLALDTANLLPPLDAASGVSGFLELLNALGEYLFAEGELDQVLEVFAPWGLDAKDRRSLRVKRWRRKLIERVLEHEAQGSG